MKRLQLTAAILLLTLLLSACGTTAAPAPEASAPAGMSSTLPGTGAATATATEAPAAADTAAPEENEAKAAALALVGEQVSKLYEAIGEPISTDYASSCLGHGEDGELVYDGFTVYTYKEGDSEVIQSVD